MQEEGKKQTEKVQPLIAENISADSIELKETTSGGAPGHSELLPVVQDARDSAGKQLPTAGKFEANTDVPLPQRQTAPPRKPTRKDKAECKPKKKRRRAADILVAIALDLVLIPMAIGVTKLVIDPAALPTAKAACSASQDNGVGYLTQALAVRNDPLLRYLRAKAYIRNQNYADAEKDFDLLAATKPCIARQVPLNLAELRIRRGIFNNETCNYLLEASSPHGLGLDDDDWYSCSPEAIRDLVIAGDSYMALQAMGQRSNVDSDDTSYRVLYQPAYKPTTKALALAELGYSGEAAKVFDQTFHKSSGYIPSDERLDHALWLLDAGAVSDVSAARKEIDIVKNVVYNPGSGYTTPCDLSVEVDLVDGWCLFEEGKLDQALAATDKVLGVKMAGLGSDSFLIHDLMTMSAHRLRSEIFGRQGKATQSQNEMTLAGPGPGGIPVNILVPKKFIR